MADSPPVAPPPGVPPGPPAASRIERMRTSPMGEVLGIRDFRYYWLANLAYFLAFGAQRFTFVWLVLELSDSVRIGGYTAFALGVPAFFITLPAGAWADRFDRRLMVIVSALAGGIVSAIIAALIWAGAMTVPIALVLALAMGFATASTQPPLTAIVPTIVPRTRLMNAIVLRTMGQNLAQIGGPAIAGLAILVAGLGGAFAAQAICFGIALLALAATRVPRLDAEPGPALRLLAQVREGLSFVFTHKGLRGLVLISIIAGVFMLGPTFVLVQELARTRLGVDAVPASALFAFTGAGMFAMSVFLATRSSLERKGFWFLVNMMIGGPVIVLIGLSPWYALTALAMFGWGLGGGVFINLNQTLVQSITPDRVMGRVMSIYMLSIAGFVPIGSLIAGVAAQAIGAHWYMAICGVVILLGGAWAWVTQPALREM